MAESDSDTPSHFEWHVPEFAVASLPWANFQDPFGESR